MKWTAWRPRRARSRARATHALLGLFSHTAFVRSPFVTQTQMLRCLAWLLATTATASCVRSTMSSRAPNRAQRTPQPVAQFDHHLVALQAEYVDQYEQHAGEQASRSMHQPVAHHDQQQQQQQQYAQRAGVTSWYDTGLRLTQQDVQRVTTRLAKYQQLPFSPMTSTAGAEAAWEACAIEDLTMDADWVGLRILADMAGVSAGARQRAKALLAAHGFPEYPPSPDHEYGQPAHYAQPTHSGYASRDHHQQQQSRLGRLADATRTFSSAESHVVSQNEQGGGWPAQQNQPYSWADWE